MNWHSQRLEKIYNLLGKTQLNRKHVIILRVLFCVISLYLIAHYIDFVYFSNNGTTQTQAWFHWFLYPTIFFAFIFFKQFFAATDSEWDNATLPGALIRCTILLLLFASLAMRMLSPDFITAGCSFLIMCAFSLYFWIFSKISHNILKYHRNSSNLFRSNHPLREKKTFQLNFFRAFALNLDLLLKMRATPYDWDLSQRNARNLDKILEQKAKNGESEASRNTFSERICQLSYDADLFGKANGTVYRITRHVVLFIFPYMILLGSLLTINIIFPMQWSWCSFFFTKLPFAHLIQF